MLVLVLRHKDLPILVQVLELGLEEVEQESEESEESE